MNNWYNEFGESLRQELRTGEYSGLCSLLGFEDDYWLCQAVRITMSSLHVSTMLPDIPELTVSHVDDGADGEPVLIAYGTELPCISSCDIQAVSWPYSPVADLSIGTTSMVLKIAGKEHYMKFSEDDGILLPEWPAVAGISGAVRRSSLPAKLTLRAKYPADFVISLANSYDKLYTLLTATGYEAAYYQEQDALERLAVLVLALYKHHKSVSSNVRS